MSPTDLSVSELARAIKERRFRVRDVVEAHLSRIEAVNPRLNAVVTLDAEGALAAADRADAALDRGAPVGVIHGVPFTLKDMHETAGMRTTLGLKMLEGHVPAEDGVVSERLKRAGGILLGKTNMAMSIQTNSELFGRTSNPYDLARTSGGSSGGAASAVASRLVPFDVGTDLSGSIRMPCRFCGVFGIKPTPQRIPLAGMMFGPPGIPRPDRVLGAAGPIARSADDLALLFGVLAGPHPSDPDVPPVPVRAVAKRDVRSLRIALAPEIDGIRIAKRVSDAIAEVGEKLSRGGARVEERSLPFSFEEMLFAFRRVLVATMAGMTRAMTPPGSPVLDMPLPTASDFFVALAERDRFVVLLEEFLSGFDAFICAPTVTAAFPHTERGAPIDVDGTATASSTVDHPALIATYTGAPSIVVPARLDADGMPLAAQCIGKRFCDEELLATCSTIADVVGTLPGPKI